MEYGSVLGASIGGMGGGAVIAALPNTGGSLRFVTLLGIVSVAAGAIVILSTAARYVVTKNVK